MLELVEGHSKLADPMETAIWIRPQDREAWLVELIPSFGDFPHPERPVSFNPGLTFRHPLNMIAGNLESLRQAFVADARLARDVAEGEVLYGQQRGSELQEIARAAYGHAQAG